MAGAARSNGASRGSAPRRGGSPEGLPSSERIYLALRKMILSGELPPETRLVETQFAEQFNVSRTPVREALKRLASDKLVQGDPVRGLIVHDPEPHEVSDMYLVREVLESLATQLAAQRISTYELHQLRMAHESMASAVENGRADLAISANLAFHDVIYRSARNDTLFRLSRELSDLVQRFSASAFSDKERVQAVVDEHAEILAALEKHDPQEAATASSRHMQSSSSNLLRLHHERLIGI